MWHHKSIIFCNRKYHQRIYGIRLHFYIFLSALLYFGIYLWTWFYQNVQNIFINYVNFEQQRNTATRFTFFPSFSSPRSLIHSLLRSLKSASWRYGSVLLHKREYITVGEWVVVLSAGGCKLLYGFVKIDTWISWRYGSVLLHKREYITVGKWVVVLSAGGPVMLENANA